jgi:tetratricopeptide (TPR) repeat protein
VQVREARAGAGYCSSHDPRLHFGLGPATAVETLEIRWPSGAEQTIRALPADRLVTVDEERGVTAIATLAGSGRADRMPEAAPATAPPSSTRAVVPTSAAARRLGAEDVRRVDAWVQAGTGQILAGRYDEGIESLRRALAALPPWETAAASPDALGFGDRDRYRVFLAALHDNLGVGLLRAERLDECAAAIERALELTPGRASFLQNLGLCHFHARRYREAIAAFEAAARRGEPSPDLRYDAGRALAAAGRCDEATAALEAALAGLPRPDPRGRDAEAWYHRGVCLADGGRHVEAVAAFREVLARVPGHQKALYRLFFALRRGGEEAAAERAHRLFRARQPRDEDVRALKRSGSGDREGRLRLARGYLEAGLAPQAAQEAQMLLAADRRDTAALVVLGQALLALRPPALDAAGDAFGRAVALAPELPAALAGLGEVLRREGDDAAATGLFDRALALAPDEPTATIGLARLAGGATGAALARLEALAARRSDDPAVLAALAALYAAAPDGSGPRRALELLARTPDLYGEGEEARVRALLRLGEHAEARRRVAASPFFGATDRAALAE